MKMIKHRASFENVTFAVSYRKEPSTFVRHDDFGRLITDVLQPNGLVHVFINGARCGTWKFHYEIDIALSHFSEGMRSFTLREDNYAPVFFGFTSAFLDKIQQWEIEKSCREGTGNCDPEDIMLDEDFYREYSEHEPYAQALEELNYELRGGGYMILDRSNITTASFF